MEYFELIQKRYSVRAYKGDPVDEKQLGRILEAARLAPTAANCQPYRIIVAHTKGREEELRRVYHRPWFLQAPLVLCVCALPGHGWVRQADKHNLAEVDASIAMTHLILAAADLGLGTCWIAAFDGEAARKTFGLPADVLPVALTPLGYPADTRPAKVRKPLNELVRFERW